VGRTLVAPSTASGRETGLGSLLRVGVSTPSDHVRGNRSVIALRLQQHRRQASSPYVLQVAASVQVLNGMMVLLGRDRFDLGGMRMQDTEDGGHLHLSCATHYGIDGGASCGEQWIHDITRPAALEGYSGAALQVLYSSYS
jgi:hypothetical protein